VRDAVEIIMLSKSRFAGSRFAVRPERSLRRSANS
jgi:hypothetical protein